MKLSQDNKIHVSRVQRTPEQSIVISLFKADIQPIFGEPKESRKATVPLSGLKILEMWNYHNSVRDVYPHASQSLKDQRTKLLSSSNRELHGSPKAKLLTTTLLGESFAFWMTMATELEAFYNHLTVTTYGDSPTMSGRQECWTVIMTMLCILFCELRKVRVVVEMAYSSSDDHICTGTYLWATFRSIWQWQSSWRQPSKIIPRWRPASSCISLSIGPHATRWQCWNQS